jgi:hypothetical protein
MNKEEPQDSRPRWRVREDGDTLRTQEMKALMAEHIRGSMFNKIK